MLASGADLKVVQRRLRHSNIGTTGDRYVRLLPGTEGDAVVRFEGALNEAEGDYKIRLVCEMFATGYPRRLPHSPFSAW